jgi:hypothetical protein
VTKKEIAVTLPRVGVKEGSEIIEYSLNQANKQNAGWELFAHGLALVLTNKEAGLTLGAMMGSTKSGSTAVAALTTLDRQDMTYELLSFDYRGKFDVIKLETWLNDHVEALLEQHGVELKYVPEDEPPQDNEASESEAYHGSGNDTAKDETHVADDGKGAEDTGQQEDGAKAGEVTG